MTEGPAYPLPDDPARWRAVKALFEEALARPPGARAAFLDDACRAADGTPDAALRSAVEALLDADTEADDFLDDTPTTLASLLGALAATAPPGADPGSTVAAGSRIGPYRVVRPLGSGGMGEVFLAERADGLFERRVAVKRVRAGLEHAALASRFEAERRILAALQHPGIARLLDAGADADGRPWLAMDYVEGAPITAYARTHGLGLDARLALFEAVCEAVHHAHQRLVVHRDLKPSNVLVTTDEQGKPRPVLLDFGIARLLDDEGEALTETGLRPMTRAYAAPEQLRGEAATTATDVYALGVLLYELLTGRRPFEAPTPAQLEAAILSEEPTRPSRAAPVPDAAPAAVPPARLRGDLDTIVLRALRKEPGERYASAAALAEDVRRYRAGQPIQARPPTLGYRLRLLVRRHPAGVAAGAAALAVLVAFAALLAVQQRATARERDAAETAAAFLADLFATVDPFSSERRDTLRVRDLLDWGLSRVNAEFAEEPRVRARLLLTIGEAFIHLGMHPKAEAPVEEATALWRAAGDPTALARSLAALAEVRLSQLRYEEAEALAREALAVAPPTLDAGVRTLAEGRLARALLGQSRFEEAEAFLQETLARVRARHGPDHPAAIATERSLALVYVDEGRLDEAEALLLDVRARYARLYGPDDPRLLDALGPLTFLYLTAGRTDEAAAVGAEAVALARAARPGSSTLSQVLAAHAAALRRQGRLDEAEATYREALALPPLRPEAHAVPLGGLASVLAARGDLAGAVEAQRQAVALLEAASAPSLPFSQVKLAGFLRDLGRFAEAERLLLDSAAAVREAGGSDHPGTNPVPAALAALYEAWGRPAEAARWRARMDR